MIYAAKYEDHVDLLCTAQTWGVFIDVYVHTDRSVTVNGATVKPGEWLVFFKETGRFGAMAELGDRQKLEARDYLACLLCHENWSKAPLCTVHMLLVQAENILNSLVFSAEWMAKTLFEARNAKADWLLTDAENRQSYMVRAIAALDKLQSILATPVERLALSLWKEARVKAPWDMAKTRYMEIARTMLIELSETIPLHQLSVPTQENLKRVLGVQEPTRQELLAKFLAEKTHTNSEQILKWLQEFETK